jgi:hypothetical protein
MWPRCAVLGVLAACSFEQRSMPDAGVTRDTLTPPGDTAGACVDLLEPNDTIETASDISFEQGTFVSDALSICPSGDTDNFRIEIGSNQTIEAILMVLSGDGDSLDFIVLNENNGPIAIAENLGGLNYLMCAQNLPAGVYFLQIGKASDAVYRLSVAPPGMGGMCN